MSISGFTLTALQEILPRRLITDTWVQAETDRAEKVLQFREYADGEHDAKMTTEMRKMLRLSNGEELNANYCDTVISTMASRVAVDGMNGETEAATQWFADLMKKNRFDSLQIDVHDGKLIAGDTFVMVSYDAELGYTKFTHEPAYDGTEGVLAVYNPSGDKLEAAVKVWQEVDDNGDDFTRVNVYTANELIKYKFAGNFVELERAPWAVGKIPLVHFKNRVKTGARNGTSELKQVVPLQNILNRVLASMTFSGEVSAFPLIEAKGVEPPQNLTPGAFLMVGMPPDVTEDNLAAVLSAIGFKRMEQGDLVPYIAWAEFVINQIATTSQTPIPELIGTVISGEALKQRESGLLGKVREFQIKTGNEWEDVATLAQAIEAVFNGKKPPANDYWTTHWKPAELRNDSELVDRALKIADKIPNDVFLEIIAPLFEWDNDKIQLMLAQMNSAEADRIALIGSQIPAMNSGQFEVMQNSGTIEQEENQIPDENQINQEG